MIPPGMDEQLQRPEGWTDALSAYVTTMIVANRSRGTVRLHRHYLGQLRAAHPRTPWTITLQELELFLACPTWGPEARKSARSVVRTFYRWAYGRGWISHDPAAALPSVHVPIRTGRPAPEHVVSILTAREDRVGYMAMLGSYQGMRAAEIARVHGDDVETRQTLVGPVVYLRVYGKGDKERILPVVHPRLTEWLTGLGPQWAFPNGRGSHLSPGHVTKLLSGAMTGGHTGHQLRHRAATTAYQQTKDILKVSRFLGHAKVETTQRYVALYDDELLGVVTATSSA